MDFIPLISHFVVAAVSAGLAWYIRGRGMTGVKVDLDNVKKDIEDLKAKIVAHTPTV